MIRDEPLIPVGADAGGTHTRMLAASGAPEDGPPANLQVAGVEGVADVIATMARQTAGSRPVALVAGVAGAGRPEERHALAKALKEALPGPSRIRILSDAELALDAAYGPSGIGYVVVAGTGSIVLVRTADGAMRRSGGWGYLLGDEGGGYRLGLQGLAAVADALDGGPETELVRSLAHAWDVRGGDALIRAVYAKNRSPAGFAVQVLDAAGRHDPVAHAIVGRHADALARRLVWLARREKNTGPDVALLGGLTGHPAFRDALETAVGARLPEARLVDPARSPVQAAFEAAGRLASDP